MNSTLLLDVADKLRALADSLTTACSEQPVTAVEEPAKAEAPTVPLEKLRGVLAEKSQQGFTSEVKDLIRRYGADKLSDIDPDRFPDMLKEAEAIGNA